jgi:lipopolysaccharide/colanic/teichoic acid biosynthesis glycosyltransferase
MDSLELAPEGTAAEPAPLQVALPWPAERRPVSAEVLRGALKRSLDVLVSAIVLVALMPVIAIVAMAILIESRGPVLYRAERVGRGGRTFAMLKFRKMHADAGGLRLTTRDDARFTRVGAFLARSKLDELPQFLNVLRGEMSLIGPRPEDADFVARRRSDYDVILQVRPGITGLAQIAFAEESRILSVDDPLGHYLHGILPQKCALDRLYVRSTGLWTDMRILFWTFVTVLLRCPVAVHRSTGGMNPRRRRERR